MTPNEEKRAMNVYLPLMDEIVARIHIVNVSARNDPGFAPGFVRELCYLQFRAICELIAVGCLAIYGDKKVSTKLINTYEASKIITALQKLAPNCYPQPISIGRDGKHVSITGLPNSNQLTRADLVRLWGKSGDVLHRSPFSKVTKTTDLKSFDLSDIWHWTAKMTGLLNTHCIVLDWTTTAIRIMTVALKEASTGLPSAAFLALSLADGNANASMHQLRRPTNSTF